jgi:hypothetical protein
MKFYARPDRSKRCSGTTAKTAQNLFALITQGKLAGGRLLGYACDTHSGHNPLALRQVRAVAASRPGAKSADREAGHPRDADGGGIPGRGQAIRPYKRGGEIEVRQCVVRIDLDRSLQLVDRAVYPIQMQIGAAHEQMPDRQHRVARTQSHGLGDMRLGLLGASEKNLGDARVGMRIGVIGVELKRNLKFPKRLLSIGAQIWL